MLRTHIPAHLPRWQTLSLYWTSLAVVLACDILMRPIPTQERTPAQNLSLRTYEVISSIVEASPGYHVTQLSRM